MHRSYWDLEVYARDFRQRRLGEAERSRLADEAVGVSRVTIAANAVRGVVARVWSAWKTRLMPTPTAAARQPVAESVDTAAAEAGVMPNTPRGTRLAQPYADMMVVARGPMVGVTEQPCGVSDC